MSTYRLSVELLHEQSGAKHSIEYIGIPPADVRFSLQDAQTQFDRRVDRIERDMKKIEADRQEGLKQ